MAADPWWLHFKVFNLIWLIDPSPDGTEVDRLRYVEVIGLAVGQAVQLQVGDGAAIATATPAASGIATISHLASDAARDLIPGVVRIDEAGAGAAIGAGIEANPRMVIPSRGDLPTGARNVHVTYVECVPWATLRREVAYSWLAIGGWNGNRAVSALAGDRLDVFSLHDPARPIPVRTIWAPDAAGHLLADSQLLVWGPRGLSRYTPDGARERILDDEPVLGVVVVDDIFAILHHRRLEIYSVADGSHIARHEVDDAQAIAATSRGVVLATARGLEIFAPTSRSHLGLIAVNDIASGRKLFASNAVRPRTAVCVEDRQGTWSVIDLAEPLQPRHVAQYHARPWFIGANLGGRLLARITDDGALSLSTIGRSLGSWPDATFRERRTSAL